MKQVCLGFCTFQKLSSSFYHYEYGVGRCSVGFNMNTFGNDWDMVSYSPLSGAYASDVLRQSGMALVDTFDEFSD